jgi:hypothetical protein
VTDHDCVDYVSLANSARLIVDTRNAALLSGGFGRLDTRFDTPPSTKRRHPDPSRPTGAGRV